MSAFQWKPATGSSFTWVETKIGDFTLSVFDSDSDKGLVIIGLPPLAAVRSLEQVEKRFVAALPHLQKAVECMAGDNNEQP